MHLVYCQECMVVNEDEVVQVLEKFVYISNLPDHDYSGRYAVKIVKEIGSDKYNIAITDFCYKRELPKDSLLYIKIKYSGLFVILSKEITLCCKNNSKFISDMSRIEEISDSLLYSGGVGYYPEIVIFRVDQKRCFSKNKIVKYETFMPIINVPMKYWPITKRVNAIINNVPRFIMYDRFGNENEEWKAKIKNGKGKFKIKAQKGADLQSPVCARLIF